MMRRFCSGSSTSFRRVRNISDASLTVRCDAELAGENVFHPLALARAQQPIVDEHAFEPLADRAMNQRRRDRRIDAAGKAEQHLVARADLVANLGDLGLDEIRHRPVAGLAANPEHEVAQHLRAARRMHDLGMKLDAANSAVLGAHRRARSVRRYARWIAASTGIASTRSPWLIQTRCSWPSRPSNSGSCASICRVAGPYSLRLRGRRLRAEMRRDDIHAVADAEDVRVGLQHFGIDIGRVLVVEAGGPARQDDAARLHRADLRQRKIERVDFAIHVGFAHPSRD